MTVKDFIKKLEEFDSHIEIVVGNEEECGEPQIGFQFLTDPNSISTKPQVIIMFDPEDRPNLRLRRLHHNH